MMETIPYFFSVLLIFLAIWQFQNYQKYQVLASKKNEQLAMEFDIENKKTSQLKNVSKKIINLEKNTNQKLVKIQIEIINIDFTLNEIWCNT